MTGIAQKKITNPFAEVIAEHAALAALRFDVISPFTQAARCAAYPHIDYDGIYDAAAASKVCPLIPETDEMSLLSAEEHLQMLQIIKQLKEDAQSALPGETKETELMRIHLVVLSLANIRLAALIRKAGMNVVVMQAPPEIGSKENMALYDRYGLNLLKTVALQAKALTL